MANSVIYNKFRYSNLQRFMNSLVGDTNPLYLGIGRPYYWNTTLSNDSVIPVTNNSVRNETLDWNDMMFLKRINFSDVAYGIVKTAWEAGMSYDQYRTDWDGTRVSVYDGSYPTDISSSHSMVINSNNEVWICLKHPAPTNPLDASTVPPSTYSPETGTDIGCGIVKTADNYYWKYLSSTSSAMLLNFAAHTVTVSYGASSFHPILTLTVNPGTTDFFYKQWQAQVASATYKGGIYAINVTASGSGYNGGSAGTRGVTSATTDAQLKVIGDGTGLQYNVIYGSGGTIVDIEVTNPGSGYSYATITAVGGIGFNYDIVFTPRTGLGVDPAKDADAVYLLISTQLAGNEGAVISTQNDYRKVSLVSAPKVWNSATLLLTQPIADATTKLTIDKNTVSGTYSVDAIITGGTSGAKGRVVDYVAPSGGNNGFIRYIRTDSENQNSLGAALPFQVSETITSSAGAGTGTLLAIGVPDVQPYGGDIIYSEYRSPIPRSDDQTEAIRCIIQF